MMQYDFLLLKPRKSEDRNYYESVYSFESYSLKNYYDKLNSYLNQDALINFYKIKRINKNELKNIIRSIEDWTIVAEEVSMVARTDLLNSVLRFCRDRDLRVALIGRFGVSVYNRACCRSSFSHSIKIDKAVIVGHSYVLKQAITYEIIQLRNPAIIILITCRSHSLLFSIGVRIMDDSLILIPTKRIINGKEAVECLKWIIGDQ